MLTTGIVGLALASFRRGQREADYVTREELDRMETRIASTYARSDVTGQRIDVLEDRVAEVRSDVATQRKELHSGIERICDRFDALPFPPAKATR
jgi:hypothetical protein